MKLKIIALAVAASLCGCTTAILKPISTEVDKTSATVDTALRSVRAGEPAETAQKQATSIKYVNSVWLPVKKIDVTYNKEAELNLSRIVAVNRRFTNLGDSVSYITALTGVPTSMAVTANSSTSGASVTAPAGPMLGVVPVITGSATQATGSATQATGSAVAYNGKLSGLLDLIAARYNVYWEWEGRGIRFFKTKSKTFSLAALPGDTTFQSTVGNTSSGGGSSAAASSSSVSGSSSSQIGIQFSGLSVWNGVQDSIKTMLSPDGKIMVTPATGTITVDDTPVVLERVSKFIEEQNITLSRQVVINVKVLSVDLNDSNEYGVNWNAVYQNVNHALGFTLANSFSAAAGASNLTFNVVKGTSPWGSSTAMIDALSKQGKVSQVTSASIVTLNNQPAPIQVATQTSYLASSTTTLGTAGSGNSTTLQPGQVTTGFSMNMLPHILDSDKLMLQYSGDISSLTSLNTVSSGGSSIQTPNIDTRNFLQRVIMRGGETLVVSGFEQVHLSGASQGVGSPENVALGGGVNTNKTKSVLVVLIQPVLTGNK